MTTEHARTTDVPEHGHHWEVSWSPIVLSLGVTLLVPLGFASYFVYNAPLFAILLVGLGTPLIVAGISRWIYEGATRKLAISNIADLGIGIFITSEILIFLSLFAGYWTMRLSAGAAGEIWPPAGTPEIDLILPLVMTAVLVSSSVTYHMGEICFYSNDAAGHKKWLLISIALGILFVGFTVYEYNHLIRLGFTPSTNFYSTAFYTLTGFHASHVAVGALSFIAIYIAILRGAVAPMLVKGAGIYWHFVDVVWFFVASQVYYW